MNTPPASVRFSIIIPVFNQWEVTRLCLDAIGSAGPQAQYEIIVVDNASTDATAGELQRRGAAGELTIVRNSSNEPYSRANNNGAGQARGEYLVFLNNDTKVFPGWLDALQATFEAEPSVGVQGGKLLYPDGRIQHAGIVYGPVNAEGLLLHYHLHLLHDKSAPYVNTPREFQMVTGALLAIRADLFRRVGGFDEQYYFGHEDLDLCMKVREAGFKVWYNPAVMAYHFESLTKKLVGIDRFERYITHPDSYDAANDRRFHSRWGGVLQVDAERYYSADGVQSPLVAAGLRPTETKNLRILMTMFGWTESGGGTTFPRAVAKRLVRLGHNVAVVFAAGRHPHVREPYFLERFEEDGVEVYGVYNRGTVFLDEQNPDREIDDPRAVARFRQVLRSFAPDVIHLHNLLGLSFAIARAARESGLPVLYTPYNYHLIDPMLYLINQDLVRWKDLDFSRNSALARMRPDLAPAYARRAEAARTMLQQDIDYTLAVSNRVREILVQFGAPVERTFVVHQVHETVEHLRNTAGPPRTIDPPVRFGYIGGVMPHKGVHLIAAAAQNLPVAAAAFMIHGFVSDDYREFLGSIDVRGALTFCGPYSAADLPRIGASVDVMILPSLWEDCAPFAITEALAMGAPVIAPATGGFPDFVRDGWNGRLFPPGDGRALENVIEEILEDPSLVRRWAEHTTLPAFFDDHVRHVMMLYGRLHRGLPLNSRDAEFYLFPHARSGQGGKVEQPAEPPQNRRRLERDVRGGYSNHDAVGKLPDPLPSPLYLNLGCGRDVRRGFVNIDLYSEDPQVVRMDIRKLELPDNSVDGWVAHDVLEHFSHREIRGVLNEWSRVLKPGAEYMIRCPSLALQCKAYASGVWDADVASFMIFGGQSNPGDYHCVAFDRVTIARHLTAAGLDVTSIEEDDRPQDGGFINLNMTVKGRKSVVPVLHGENPGGGAPAVRKSRVVWEGPQFATSSLALVNRELCLRLMVTPDVELVLLCDSGSHAQVDGSHRLAPIRELAGRTPPGPVDVHVRHLWPANLTPPPEGHWVVIQPWEYGSLPHSWVTAWRDAVDEFWVPSRYVRDCYVQSGIPADRVIVIPNGVDGDLFRPGVRPLKLSTRKRFKFLFVGGTLHRKGFDLLLEAYGSAFARSDDVCLVVKDMGSPTLYEGVNGRDLVREFESDPSHPEIEYIDRSIDEKDMPALYGAVDCLVHPFRGEGFGLPIAEAMAAELPVIVTGEGAAMDFCSEETAYLLPARKGRLSEKSIGGVHTVDYPWLFEPDVEVLVRMLRHVREHRAEAAEKGRKARRHVLTELPWDKAAALVHRRLTLLGSRPVLRFSGLPQAPHRGGTTMHSTRHHTNVEPGLQRARALDQGGRTAEAEEVLKTLARIYPDDTRVPLEHVRLLVASKEFARAMARIAETPLSHKVDLEWLELTAECTEGLGDSESADTFANQILERAPGSARALCLRGRIAAQKGDTGTAMQFFRAAMDADPRSGTARGLLGSLLLQHADRERGLTLIEEGFALSPLDGDLLVSLADAAREAGCTQRAAALLAEAVQHNPGNKRLRYFYAEMLAGLEQPEQSLQVVLGCLAEFGIDDEALAFALRLRVLVGPREIRLDVPRGTTVSACMIIKNEEHFLAPCLWSILPLVHEIIVLDTGSTDRSEEIAGAFGAKVFHAEWTNDFSQARNASLEAASGDWILVMDGDEVLSAADLEKARGLTVEPGTPSVAYSFVTRNYLVPMDVIGWVANDGMYREEAGTGWIPSEKVRLFPRRNDVRFEHPVHELVEGSLGRAGIPIIKADVPIHHYGKLDATRTREKAEQYLLLGRRKLAEKGMSDLGALFELAFQENDLGNHREALRLYERIQQLNGSIPRVHFGMASSFVALKRYDDAVRPLTRAIGLDPSLKEAYVQLALVYLCLGRIEPATAAVEQLNDLGLDYPPGTALLAAVRFAKGDRVGGRQALADLDRKGISYGQYFMGFARFLKKEGKPEIAAEILEPFAESEDPPEDVALLLVDCYRDVALSRSVPGKTAGGG